MKYIYVSEAMKGFELVHLFQPRQIVFALHVLGKCHAIPQ